MSLNKKVRSFFSHFSSHRRVRPKIDVTLQDIFILGGGATSAAAKGANLSGSDVSFACRAFFKQIRLLQKIVNFSI